MRPRLLPLLIAGIALASGCSGGATPQPMITPTPVPSGHASATPTASPSGAPIGSQSPTPTPSASASASPAPTGSPGLTGTGLYVSVPYPNAITQVTTTLTVPPEPPATGAVIVWPGLVPCCSGSNPTFLPIDSGTLQPELTWGSTSAPTSQPSAYSTWWISGQYNNFAGSQTGYTGFQSGTALSVNPGDSIVETLSLAATTWTEQIADQTTGQSTSFAIDLLGQTQNELFFYMQGSGQNPVGPVTFSNTTFTTSGALSSASACALSNAGTIENDTQSTPTLSGTTCSIANITLLPAASSVPALRNRAPSMKVRFPAPWVPSRPASR